MPDILDILKGLFSTLAVQNHGSRHSVKHWQDVIRTQIHLICLKVNINLLFGHAPCHHAHKIHFIPKPSECHCLIKSCTAYSRVHQIRNALKLLVGHRQRLNPDDCFHLHKSRNHKFTHNLPPSMSPGTLFYFCVTVQPSAFCYRHQVMQNRFAMA